MKFPNSVMIPGGLLQIAYFGSRPMSLDLRARTHTGEGILWRQLR